MKRKLNNAGFSLVEVILSMAILAIISIPLLSYFSDSMKYNAKMGDKQHATAMAQELLEQLKNEDKLVQKDPSGSFYTVPYLTGKGYTLNGASTLDASGGGEASFVGTASATHEDYDAVVHVKTNTSENNTPVSEVNGIDDTQDVIATESAQQQEALVHFKAVNAAYAGTSGSSELSSDEIKSKMFRTISIDIQPSGINYKVKVGCSYTCKDLQGTGSSDTYECAPFAENQVSSVRRVYLLFRVNENQDIINITAATGLPELQLICQNKAAIPGAYQCQITGEMPGTVITNIGKDGCLGKIFDNAGYEMTSTKKIVEKNTKIRKVDIEVQIYQKGQALTPGAEPYITVHTAKGE